MSAAQDRPRPCSHGWARDHVNVIAGVRCCPMCNVPLDQIPTPRSPRADQ